MAIPNRGACRADLSSQNRGDRIVYTTSVSLLERLRHADDHEAWGRFVRVYTPLLLGWARRAGLQACDADDLLQEVFLLLRQELPQLQYDPTRSFRAWLKTVTANKLRNLRSRRAAQTIAGNDSALARVPDAEDPVEGFDLKEHQDALIRRALRVMQKDFEPHVWKAVWEFVACGRPAKEVAREFGMTPGAVYAAKLRVINRLREEFKGMVG